MLVVNLSIGGLLFVGTKVVDVVDVRALEDERINLELIRGVEHLGLLTCGKMRFCLEAIVSFSCNRRAGCACARRF